MCSVPKRKSFSSSPSTLRTVAGRISSGGSSLFKTTYELATARSSPSREKRCASRARSRIPHQRASNRRRIEPYSCDDRPSTSAAVPRYPSHGASKSSRAVASVRACVRALTQAMQSAAPSGATRAPHPLQGFHPAAAFARWRRVTPSRRRPSASWGVAEAAGVSPVPARFLAAVRAPRAAQRAASRRGTGRARSPHSGGARRRRRRFARPENSAPGSTHSTESRSTGCPRAAAGDGNYAPRLHRRVPARPHRADSIGSSCARPEPGAHPAIASESLSMRRPSRPALRARRRLGFVPEARPADGLP